MLTMHGIKTLEHLWENVEKLLSRLILH